MRTLQGLLESRWFVPTSTALALAVARVIGERPLCRGHGDLALADGEKAPRKILGASLRQTARQVVYLGALLVADRVALMERYLTAPSREPDYRVGRGHGTFCTHLSAYGASVSSLSESLEKYCRKMLMDKALIA